MSWWVLWFPSAAAQTWWDPDWEHRARLTFANGDRAEDLVDFPVLAVLADGVNFDHALADASGADLRFVDADGVTVLPHEIESWNVGGVSTVWVSVPRIDALSDADHAWLYFGGPSVPADGGNVWPEAAAVWHLGSFADASGRGHLLWDDDHTDPGPALVAGGRILDGDDDQLKAADHPDFDFAGGFTVSAWVQVGRWDHGYDALVTKGDQTWRLHRCDRERAASFAVNFSDAHRELCGTRPLDDGGWHQVVGVYDPEGGLQTLYVDGAMDAEAAESRPPAVSGSEVLIGNNQEQDDRDLEGRVDEVRLEPVVRSAAWVSADHASVTDTLVGWCTPAIGLGDADGDGTCDADDVREGPEDCTVAADSASEAPPPDGPPRTAPTSDPLAVGCGCDTGGTGIPWVVALLLTLRSVRGASAGSPGPRPRRARARLASRATPPGPLAR